MLHPARDPEGLRIAFRELFKEEQAWGVMRRALARTEAANTRRALDSLPQFTIAAGYYAYADYLLWLRRMRGLGAVFEKPLLATEMAGLQVLEEELAKFDQAFPACFACGTRNASAVKVCAGCGKELR